MAPRKRLSPEEFRIGALAAARRLLIEAGPQSVTLKAVGARIGRTHANLLHHFGSAAGLQRALADHLAATVCETIAEAVHASRAGIGTPREVVDLAFDAFDREGGGALVSWMLATGQEDAIEPFVERINSTLARLRSEDDVAVDADLAREATLAVVLLGLGQSLLGEPLTRSLQLPGDAARNIAERFVAASVAAQPASG